MHIIELKRTLTILAPYIGVQRRVTCLLSEISYRENINFKTNNLKSTKICLYRSCYHFMSVVGFIEKVSGIYSMMITTLWNVHHLPSKTLLALNLSFFTSHFS